MAPPAKSIAKSVAFAASGTDWLASKPAAACGDEERRGAERVSVCIGVHTRLEQPRRRRQAAQQRCIKELLGLWV